MCLFQSDLGWSFDRSCELEMVLLDVRPTSQGYILLRIAHSQHSNLPIGAAVFVLVFLGLTAKVKEESVKMMTFKEKTKQFDFLGAVLLLGVVFCLFLALEWGGEKYPWKSSQVVGLWIGFGLLFLAFCLSQALLGDKATIPPRILKQRTILYGALALSFISMSSNIVSLDWSYEPLAEAHNGTRSYTTFHSTSRPLKEYPYYKAVSDFWH